MIYKSLHSHKKLALRLIDEINNSQLAMIEDTEHVQEILNRYFLSVT